MDIKAIAIGNPLMGDDGIALKVAEQLSDSLEKLGVEVIIGETDIDYCISRIDENDKLIVIDGSCRGEALGSYPPCPCRRPLTAAMPAAGSTTEI
jgi:hydrogenase maturation protease